MKIAVVTGTRADWGLLHPLVNELTERGERPMVIATYAHLFPEMGDTIQELVEDGFPPMMSVPTRRPAPEAVADAVTGFTKAFSFLKPDITVILGDRLESLGVATAATLAGVPIAHIAGGTVSSGAIDDVFRDAISQLATLHFPETEKGRRRLLLMGAKGENVVTAGALGVFNALHVPIVEPSELDKHLDFELGDQFLLGTFHPATARGTKEPIEQMKIWLDGLEETLDSNPGLRMLLTFPNTDTDPTALLSRLFTFRSSFPDRVKVTPSLGRVRYLNAARYAAVVAGNSSSGLVEIPSLGTPVVNVGERQEGRQCSKAVIHCDLDSRAISKAISYSLTTNAKLLAESTPNPYFRENTPGVIASRILMEALPA